MKLDNNNTIKPAYLLLENGDRYDGYSFGANTNDSGELGKSFIKSLFKS
jgi:hypothetical protein